METTQIFTEILDYTEINQEDTITNKNLLWWSKQTENEKHMLTLSLNDIKETLLMVVFAFNENRKLIAAAGIFLPRTWNNSRPIVNGWKVVEIGTNYVLPEYRRQGIGKKLIQERLDYAKYKDWFPVSISSNKTVQKMFSQVGGSLMEKDEKYLELRDSLCLKFKCKDKQPCDCCPLIPNCGWIFEINLKIAKFKDLIFIKTIESNEEMVNISEKLKDVICVYQKKDMIPYTGESLWVRKTLANKLQVISNKLREIYPTYRLKIVYGFRHPEVQELYFINRKNSLRLLNKDMNEDDLNELTNTMTAFPEIAGHPTGGTQELAFRTNKGNPIYKVKYIRITKFRFYSSCKTLKKW